MSRKSIHSTSNKNTKKPIKTVKFTPLDSSNGAEPPSKRHCASFALSNPPVFDSTNDDIVITSSPQSSSSSRSVKPTSQTQRSMMDAKGKSKETRELVGDEDDSLWVDKYQPTTEPELAVHKRKVEDVRRWLLEAFDGGPSAKLRKYRRILALTGPAGTAKTATLRVLARELDFEIVEWRNSMSERGSSALTDGEPYPDDELGLNTETLFDKFQSFLTRAMTCNSVFGHHNITQRPPSRSLGPSHSQAHASTQRSSRRQLILLEDLPNLLHQPTQVRFQAALQSLCISTSNLSEHSGPPIVIIISDSGLRAEQPDNDTWDGGSGVRRWQRKETLDIRNILGPDLLKSPYVTQIGFNPIAPTLMTKALQALLASHFGSLGAHARVGKQPARKVIDIIVGTSNGDIRSAIMALQFACVVELPTSSAKSKSKAARKDVVKKMGGVNVRGVLEAVTRREQSLVLFHLMGKILYNKRKFDPPASHLSTRDTAKERELDMKLIDPPLLPVWFSHHDRKASRVCMETLAAESPIDSSLLGLYIHQNYTQFCTEIEQCDGVCEGLSWVDCMGGSQLAYSPYDFPALTLSTLHALPTPVPRNGQKVCKPTWFDVRTKELETSDAVGDVIRWLGRGMDILQVGEDASSISVGTWTYANVATELGGWLRAVDRPGKPQEGHYPQPPGTHRLFSHLPWSRGVPHDGDSTLGENEVAEVEDGGDEDDGMRFPGGVRRAEERKGWLEDDDIEDVE